MESSLNLAINQDMLDQKLNDLYQHFAEMIKGLIGMKIQELMIQFHIVNKGIDIDLNDINPDWMKRKFHELGPSNSENFFNALANMATVTTPPMTIRQVINNLESPIDSSKLHLIITAPTLQLNENGSVFGDLRLPNMTLAKDNLDKKVKFIDFDWSGRYKGSSDGLIPDPKDNEMPHYPVDLWVYPMASALFYPDN
ncbi:hypothetical protein M378DRAFT_18450 [Amanita muscaria Koide BX008]|uniref:Protein kinase domain-containing protein n=1 Tax=Amanita muscaria (strain Koide BX008) TaxID=946122 RepID=A0A0C2W1A0_AMAMK|nr:hypothetical protein M378DRAFT_18450 [Amanita muscaria Koide BX008]